MGSALVSIENASRLTAISHIGWLKAEASDPPLILLANSSPHRRRATVLRAMGGRKIA
jgi:hypothetical protein